MERFCKKKLALLMGECSRGFICIAKATANTARIKESENISRLGFPSPNRKNQSTP